MTMKILRDFENIPDDARGSVVVLGNFDGFHKGHQKVIGEAGRIADAMKVPLSVLTMSPHPRLFFNPDQEDFCLTSLKTKADLLERFGVDHLMVLKFDKKTSTMPAQEFVLDVLLRQLGALHVVVGYDYCFGAGRRGGVSVLGWMSQMEQFGLTVIDRVMEGDHIYSSTNIRETLRQGDVRKVAERLGHWWHIEGEVLKGDQRGRTIDFPTANLSMYNYIKPRLGVYAVRVMMGEGENLKTYQGVANVGKRPTFDKEDVNLEVHIFDFDQEIYGQTIKVELVDFIRPEQKFDGLDALKNQIAQDGEKAKKILADSENQQSSIPAPHVSTYINS